MTEERRPDDDAPRAPDEEAPGAAEPAPGADGEPAPRPLCAVCGAGLEPDQTYCLECGSPTPLAPRLRRGGRAAAVVAGSMVVLGLGAGALAYAVVNDDDPGPASATGTVSTMTAGTLPVVPLPPETAPPTGGLPPDTSFTTPTSPTAPGTGTGTGTGFDTVTGPVEPPPVTTEPEPEPEPDPDPDTGASDWPPGRVAWTAVLSSVRSEGDARAAKSRLIGDGDDAGVLYSSDHPGLRSGFWVVFSGIYPDRGPAIAQATRLRPEFPGAYARRISG